MSAHDSFLNNSTIEKELIPDDFDYHSGIKSILTTNSIKKDLTCRKCGSKLSLGTMHVLTTYMLECTKISGYTCAHCRVMLFPNERTNELKQVLTNSPHARLFRLNGLDCDKYDYQLEILNKKKKALAEEKRISEVFSQNSNAVAFFRLRQLEGNNEDQYFYLVQDPRYETANNFVCPSDWRARELLAAYLEDCKKRIAVFHSTQYQVLEAQFDLSKFEMNEAETKSPSYSSKPESVLLPDLLIAKGGGYATQIKRPSREKIVNVLLYSPYNQRYEIAKATYEIIDKYEDRLYMDINRLRSFVERYGNPGIDRFYIEESSCKYNEHSSWSSLNAESILTCFGYSVSQKDALDARARQRILAEVVDLGFMPQNRVVSHLDFCISTHSSAKYAYARSKWLEDKEFIMDYKANPSRFLIPKNITC